MNLQVGLKTGRRSSIPFRRGFRVPGLGLEGVQVSGCRVQDSCL